MKESKITFNYMMKEIKDKDEVYKILEVLIENLIGKHIIEIE